LALLPALVAAVFGAASFALAGLSTARRTALLQTLAGPARAALDRYVEKSTRIEARWLVLRVFGISATAVLTVMRLEDFPRDLRFVLALVTVVLAYGIPAEIGRALVQRSPEEAAPMLLRLLRPIEYLAIPIAAPLSLVGELARSGPPSIRPPSRVTETEVELIVAEGEKDGSLAKDQSEMIRNVLDFGEVVASNVTVPRTRVRAIDVDLTPDEVFRFVDQCGHSRYPVYRDRIDNVIGILHVKDLLSYAARHDLADLKLESILRKPVAFVPESQSASTVLREMRAGRHHMAIVIDEYGGMTGILTLEDLVEEIVGDIHDEHDANGTSIKRFSDGHLLVDASLAVGDVSRALGIELPESPDYNSVGGFLVTEMGRVPKTGARLRTLGFEFVVQEADERHVAAVEIYPIPVEETSPDEGTPARTSKTPTSTSSAA
jgi:CBS domain containing-hemolysin-like protein